MAYRFDLIDLQLLVSIANEGSLTRAATRMHLSLPAASVRMKNLEQALDLRLFSRDSSGFTFLPAGQTVLRHARTVVNQLEHLQADLIQYTQEVRGNIRVLGNTTAISDFLPDVLNRFMASHPNVYFELRERLSEDIVKAVAEGAADIGVVAAGHQADGLVFTPWQRDRLVLVSGLAHPLSCQSSISFSEALGSEFIGLHEGSAIHFFLDQAAREAGKPLKIRIQVSDFETLCRMAESNVGVGILPEKVAARHARNMAVHLVRLTDVWASRELNICTRDPAGLSPLARKLVDYLVQSHD
ncbi:MAG: LysR substrate-binding domain-containing protein [Pusillimonas sp.]